MRMRRRRLQIVSWRHLLTERTAPVLVPGVEARLRGIPEDDDSDSDDDDGDGGGESIPQKRTKRASYYCS